MQHQLHRPVGRLFLMRNVCAPLAPNLLSAELAAAEPSECSLLLGVEGWYDGRRAAERLCVGRQETLTGAHRPLRRRLYDCRLRGLFLADDFERLFLGTRFFGGRDRVE